MNIRWVIILIITILFGCSTGKEISSGTVNQVSGPYPSGHGLWYNLPKTVIRVEMVAEKVVVKPGPFFRFSQRLLNITEVETESKEEWKIIGAKISTYGVPDEERLYNISTIGNSSYAAVNLTKTRILAGINLNSFDETQIPLAEVEKIISMADVQFNDVPYTEEQLIKSSTGAMAEEVAKEIYRLRQLRNQVVRGEVEMLPPDVGSYKLAIEYIDRQEKAFKELFTGKVVKQTVTRYFDFIPQANKPLNTVLLRFSQQNGFLDPMDVSGTPVYIEVETDTRNSKNFVTGENKKSINTTGLVYCNPVTAQIKVIDRTLLLTSKQVQISQFGQILRLPSDVFNNREVGVELDTSTGAVKRIFYK